MCSLRRQMQINVKIGENKTHTSAQAGAHEFHEFIETETDDAHDN